MQGVVQELRSHMPHASQPKKKKPKNLSNRSNIVANSRKTFKMVHIRKILKKIQTWQLQEDLIFHSTELGL